MVKGDNQKQMKGSPISKLTVENSTEKGTPERDPPPMAVSP